MRWKWFPYFKLQGRVAAAGGQRGHGRIGQAVGEEGAAGVGEGQMEGVLRDRRRDGRQGAKEVVRRCWCHLRYVFGAALL